MTLPKSHKYYKQLRETNMKNLKSFLTEATVGGADTYRASAKIVDFLAKKLGQEYTELDGQSYTNSSGNYFGFLYVSKTDNSAIRVNWEGNKFHSINFWIDWDYETDPTKEIFVKDAEPGKSSFAKLLPDIAAILTEVNGLEGAETENEEGVEPTEAPAEEVPEDVNESLLTERKVEYEGKLYGSKTDLIVELYEKEIDLDEIQNIVQLTKMQIKSILAKYLYGQGGSVSEIGEALGLTNQEVRKCVHLADEESAEDAGVEHNEKIKVLKGSKETVVLTKAVKKGEQYLEETQYADPDIVFDEITDYVTMAAKELLPALLITGQGGIGKSYNVEKILDQFGKRHETWEKVKGKASAAAMYNTLWYNRDKIVVFDDCDSVFKDPDAINVLKGALDSNDFREISWATKAEGMVYTLDLDDNKEILQRCQEWSDQHHGKEAIPNHFIFEGEVIFISNLTKADIYKKDAALLTRCTCIDVVLSAQGVMKRLQTVLPHIKVYKAMGARGSEGKDITDETLKQEVFDFMNSDEFLKNPRVRGKELNFRTFDQIYKLRYAELPNWKARAFACGG